MHPSEVVPSGVEFLLDRAMQVVPADLAKHPRCILKTEANSKILVDLEGIKLIGFTGFSPAAQAAWPLDTARLVIEHEMLGLRFPALLTTQLLVRGTDRHQLEQLTMFVHEANAILEARRELPVAEAPEAAA